MNHAFINAQASNRLLHQKANAGFTLIELMISIVLGLLLVAAASQLLLGGLISSRLQQGAADAQDSGLFGLDYMAKDLRLTNYGNIQNLVLTDLTPGGGVVLTADTATPNLTITNLAGVRLTGSALVPSSVLSKGAVTADGTATPSDQLTVQFLAPSAMTNCEGTNVALGDRVIQRYFLRADTTDSTAFVLACDAGSITAGGLPILSGFNDAGQVLMQRVEHMHVLLGTQDATTSKWRYYSISDYMALGATKPQIQSIQIAVLVRSLDNTNSATINAAKTFSMLDQTVKPTNTNRYVRRVYSTTIAMRNGMGSPL